MAQQNNRTPSQNPTENRSGNTAVTKAVTTKYFSELAEKYETQFDKLIPNTIKRSGIMTGQRVTALTVNLFMSNEDIRLCPSSTIFNAVGMACAVGLEFNSALGQSYIIPYHNSKTRRKEAQWQAGYRGLNTLALRSGKVNSTYANVVMPEDFFEYEYGTSEFLKHRPGRPEADMSSLDKDTLENFTHAYFYLKLVSGGTSFHVMSREEILSIRDKAAQGVFYDDGNAKASSPWNKYPREMIRKTPSKQHLKVQDLSSHLSLATGLDDQGEAGVPQDVVIDWKDYEDIDNDTKGYVSGHREEHPAPNQQTQQQSKPREETQQNGQTAGKPVPMEDSASGPFVIDDFTAAGQRDLYNELMDKSGKTKAQFDHSLGEFQGTLGELKLKVLGGK